MKDLLARTVILATIVSTKAGDGNLCYSCTNMPLPHICDTITQCGPHEDCYVERFVSKTGVTYYESGCKPNSTCAQSDVKRNVYPDCTECCNTDYCNKNFCTHSKVRSGNRCLQCTGVFNPKDCLKVSTCSDDEACAVESIFGRRNLFHKRNEKCHQCCRDENCNRHLCDNGNSILTTKTMQTDIQSTHRSSALPSTQTETMSPTTTTEPPTTTHRIPTGRDCLDIYNQNIRQNSVYQITPNNQTHFDVYCDMDAGGWTVIQRHISNSVNFTRGWNDYVRGFGDLSGNFWLGLNYIHLLTKSHVEIMFEGVTNDTNETVWMRYNNFYIEGSVTDYTMHVNETGTYNDVAHQHGYERSQGFGYANGHLFATFDHPDSQNCVYDFGGGGWWYNDCWEILVNNPYDDMNFKASFPEGAITRSEIKIR